MTRLAIIGGRVIDPAQGIDRLADLLIEGGQIVGLRPPGETPASEPHLDARGLVVAPGFVDVHVHLREPGFEHKETIATGTRAAAAGGYTTICCMANLDPPPDSAAHIRHLYEIIGQRGVIRVLPMGTVTRGLKGEELADLAEMAEAGAVAFSDDGKPVTNARLMRHALEYSRMIGRPIVSHCEDPQLAAGGCMHEGRISALLGLPGIPAAAEEVMVARDCVLARLTGGRLHVCHLSTAGSVSLVRAARAEGAAVTAEVGPHHLTLTDEWVAGVGWPENGARPRYDTSTKVNPPLRTAADCAATLAGLLDGTIDCIATDHAPHAREDKECEYQQAAFGISGIETALGSAMGLVHAGKLSLTRLIEALTAGPCRAFGLPFGSLRPGSPADVVVFDPDREWTVDPARFYSKGKNTPLAGQRLRGRVVATVFGGTIVHRDEG